ncbi:MAG: SOS response-associated peptidase [Clostridiales bacterium]|nr:SOS response-associated peptidase [Clostridiales bacterium]
MCGRYYIEIDDLELEDIVREAEKKARAYPEQIRMKTAGEIFPTDAVPVQTGPGQYQAMQWGFTAFKGRPVINARSETAFEKPMFQASMRQRRCLIPASGYYEWQKGSGSGSANKLKYQFYIPGSILYFAGCYRQEPGSAIPRFVILTRQSVGGVEAIHDRMPLILPKDLAGAWFSDAFDPAMQREAVTSLTFGIAPAPSPGR